MATQLQMNLVFFFYVPAVPCIGSVYSFFSVDKILVLLKSLKHSVSTQKGEKKFTIISQVCKAALSSIYFHFYSSSFCSLNVIYCPTHLFTLSPQAVSEPELPAVLPSQQGIEDLSEAVAGLRTVEEVMKYLEPERWQVDMEELYKPTWHVLGKSFILNKKTKGRADFMLRSEGSV